MLLLKITDKTQNAVMSSSFKNKETCLRTDLIMTEMSEVQTYDPHGGWQNYKNVSVIYYCRLMTGWFHGNHPVINLQ